MPFTEKRRLQWNETCYNKQENSAIKWKDNYGGDYPSYIISLFCCCPIFLNWPSERRTSDIMSTAVSPLRVQSIGHTKRRRYYSTGKLCSHTVFPWSKARFRRWSFHEPNLIHWIKYMKSSASDSIQFGTAQLFFTPSRAENFNCGRTLERLWFRRRTFDVRNLGNA